MVFIEDRESVFDASIDMVWKLAQAHFTDGSKIHPHAKNLVTNMTNEQTFTNSWDEEFNGQTMNVKTKGTIFHPIGIAFEIMGGPFAGSTYFVYYVPIAGNKTNVVVAGEFRSESIDPTVGDDEKLRSIVLSTFEKVFDEDNSYLENLKNI